MRPLSCSTVVARTDVARAALPTEIVAAALVLDYWPGAAKVNVAVWITVFFIVITSFNFMGVGAFGEAEFWCVPGPCPPKASWTDARLVRRFALLKIVTLLGLILVALIITAGGVPGSDPAEYPIGFRCSSDPFPPPSANAC